MKCLFLSNFFPPASRGGYEQWCSEVALGMRKHGHTVTVVTSRHNRNECIATDPDWVHRELFLEMELASLRNGISFFTERKAFERANLKRLRRLIEREEPDIILIWGMWNLPRSLAALAEELAPESVAYYLGDYWPTLPTQHQYYWQTKPRNWVTALPKLPLSMVAQWQLKHEVQPDLKFTNVMFPSKFMHDEFCRIGVKFENSQIIYGAIDTSHYQNIAPIAQNEANDSLLLLTVGRLMPEKGIHTTIEALRILLDNRPQMAIHLTVVGQGEVKHEVELYELTKKLGLLAHVTFLGHQPEEAMAAIYEKSEIVIFPSIWQEPFGRVLVEAMAAERIVVGTNVGGTVEILHHEENGLVFQPGDAKDLASQIMRLIDTPELGEAFAKAGKRFAGRKFDIQQMTTAIEEYLYNLIDRREFIATNRYVPHW